MLKLSKGEWITQAQFTCGCQVREVPYKVIQGIANAIIIEYCPKHKAAPDMYEALKALKSYFNRCYEKWENSERIMPDDTEVVRVSGDDLDKLCDDGFELLLQALTEAEGKSTERT